MQLAGPDKNSVFDFHDPSNPNSLEIFEPWISSLSAEVFRDSFGSRANVQLFENALDVSVDGAVADA